jgi:hypothetical protein
VQSTKGNKNIEALKHVTIKEGDAATASKQVFDPSVLNPQLLP